MTLKEIKKECEALENLRVDTPTAARMMYWIVKAIVEYLEEKENK